MGMTAVLEPETKQKVAKPKKRKRGIIKTPMRYSPDGLPIADNNLIVISDLLEAESVFEASPESTDRQTASKSMLLLRAIGSPKNIATKVYRFLYALFMQVNLPAQRRRLQRLKDLNYIDEIPSQWQIWVGAFDMLRFYITPGADSYYKTRGINFTFHQVLRILNDPAGMIDPVGIRAPSDSIINHLLEVVHANPVYDFQVLDVHVDGFDKLEDQTRQMVAGNHARQSGINAIVEDPAYHRRLLELIVKYRAKPNTEFLVRHTGGARDSSNFVLAECTFHTLPGVFRYFNRLPRSPWKLIKHFIRGRGIDPQYCDPEVITAFQEVYGKRELATMTY